MICFNALGVKRRALTRAGRLYRFRRDLAGPRWGVGVGFKRPFTSMPTPDETSQGALERLDERLDAFEAAREVKPFVLGMGKSASEGYRLLGQMLGGVLGGIGLGWLLDRFAHTGPWGVIGGLLIGAGLSIYATVRTASRISARAEARLAPGVPSAEEEDDA